MWVRLCCIRCACHCLSVAKEKRKWCVLMSLRPRAQAPAPDVNSGGDLPGRLHRVLSIGQTHRLLNGPTPTPATTVPGAQPVQTVVLPNELPLDGCCDLDYDSDSSNASYEVGECGEVGAGLALGQLEGVEVGARLRDKKKALEYARKRTAAVFKESESKRSQRKEKKYEKLHAEADGRSEALYLKHIREKAYETAIDYNTLKADFEKVSLALQKYKDKALQSLLAHDKLLLHRALGLLFADSDREGREVLKKMFEEIKQDHPNWNESDQKWAEENFLQKYRAVANDTGEPKSMTPEDFKELFYRWNQIDQSTRGEQATTLRNKHKVKKSEFIRKRGLKPWYELNFVVNLLKNT